ncbi:MAG TPA: 3-keto-5-aminohexanoate cleavage protein [Gaiellaceae bacterium]|jgi:3-keto-5-aminohexanoate cleavage enzyme
MTWDAKPVVITVAPTGAEVTRDHNPALPHTPAEIAADALACAEAGAAVVHIHVREEDGTPSSRPELFAETIETIRASSPMITMVSTGGAVWMSIDQRTTGLDARPDVSGVETGSLNFGEDPFVTVPSDARAIVERATALGIGLEVEAFDVGHVVQAVRMLERGELPAPLRANLVFGVPGGIDASPEALDAMVRPLPPDTHWCVTAVGRHQRRLLALGLLRGAGGIRVGFEDGVYLRKGVLAASNAELVADAATIVQTLGRRVATIDEARELLELEPARATA